MAISMANSDISMAYDIQKEREDTPNTLDNYFDGDGDDENIIGIGEMDVNVDMSIKDIVNNILEDIINNKPEKNDIPWNEENIDKTHPEYGSRIDDWSPHVEDYINEENDDDTFFPPSSPPSEEKP